MEAHSTNPTAAEAPSRRAERPVFVDNRGWRHALARAAIVLGAVLIAAWLIALGLGASGWGGLPGLPFPGSDRDPPATFGGRHLASGRAVSPGRAISSLAHQRANRHANGPTASGPPAPHRSRPPLAPTTTPASPGALAPGASRGFGSESPLASGGAPTEGPEASAGSAESTTNPGAGAPGHGTESRGRSAAAPARGTESRSGGGPAPSPPAHEGSRPSLTPGGTVPTKGARGGDPNALAYGRAENPIH